MVDDGAILRVVDNIHGDELSTEWHHVEVSFNGLVLLQHLREKEEGREGVGRRESTVCTMWVIPYHFIKSSHMTPTDLAEIRYVGTPWGSIHLCTVSA